MLELCNNQAGVTLTTFSEAKISARQKKESGNEVEFQSI